MALSRSLFKGATGKLSESFIVACQSQFKNRQFLYFGRSFRTFQITLNEANYHPKKDIKDTGTEEIGKMDVGRENVMSASPIPKVQNPARTRKPSGIVAPPIHKGMTELDKRSFERDIKIPAVYIYEDSITSQTLQQFKKFMLKIQGLKPVGEATTPAVYKDSSSDPERRMKRILINPELVKGQDFAHFVEHEIQPNPAIVSSIGYESIKFKYENWTLVQVLDAILPDEDDKLSSFSQIGPIVHVNLRDHLLPYKSIIGQVLLDKVTNAKTVVNKINVIESKYRNFQMELLAGDPNTIVTVKENRCEFEFDFATVYWNPRLSSEHDRLVKLIEPGEVMYDVFAGVGPFTIPAAKKKINVIANDLNPDSFKWLEHNVKKNKVTQFVRCFNQDGRAFIKETASLDLQKRLSDTSTNERRFHFAMNLPALAVEFLDSFWGILSNMSGDKTVDNCQVLVHVYCFIKDLDGFKEKAVRLVKDNLGYELPDECILESAFVRNVAPNKEMLRVSFRVPSKVLVDTNRSCAGTKRKLCELEDK